jgi:diphthine-ammonia ligase
MDVIGLVSGGKDSIYNLLECVRLGHRIVALANLCPAEEGRASEHGDLDSFMFQTVGHDAVPVIAAAMGLPLVRRTTRGLARDTSLAYDAGGCGEEAGEGGGEEEVDDLACLLREAKAAFPSATGVAAGAVLSNYQRHRIEAVAARPDIALLPLTLLWQRSQARLVEDMVAARVQPVLIKVAAYGLGPAVLGKPLAAILPDLLATSAAHGLSPAGEGGEYESLTLDCPGLYVRGTVELPGAKALAPERGGVVAHLSIPRVELVGKAATVAEREAEVLRRAVEAEGAGWEGVAPPTLPPASANAGTRAGPTSLDALPRPSLSSACASSSLPAQAVRVGLHDGTTVAASIAVFMDQLHVGGLRVVAEGRDASAQGPAGHTTALLEALCLLLAERGAVLADVVATHLYLADMGSFGAVNGAYGAFFGPGHPPARSCVAVPQPPPTFLTMDAVALRGSGWAARAGRRSVRRGLSVASLSRWAPLCIGPYCQAVTLGGALLFPAGQIGMRPERMALVQGGAQAQLVQALTSLTRVLASEECASALTSALALTVYVSLSAAEEAGEVGWASLMARAGAWVAGMYGVGLEPLPVEESSEGGLRMSEVEDFEPEEGRAKGAVPARRPTTAPGLDDAGEEAFDAYPSAHTPPAYLVHACGVDGVDALLSVQRSVYAGVGGRDRDRGGLCPPPLLPRPAARVLPLIPVLVSSLPRGAAVEVEAWGVSAEAARLGGGVQCGCGGEGGVTWVAHWLPNVAASIRVHVEAGASLLAAVKAIAASTVRAGLPRASLLHVRVMCVCEGAEAEEAVRAAWEEEGGPLPSLTVVGVPRMATTAGCSGAGPVFVLHATAWDCARASGELWLRRLAAPSPL